MTNRITLFWRNDTGLTSAEYALMGSGLVVLLFAVGSLSV